MDYIKWLILEKNRHFIESGAFIPVFFLNIVVIGAAVILYWPIAAILATICAIPWGLIIFFFAQEAFRENYNEYLRKRGK